MFNNCKTLPDKMFFLKKKIGKIWKYEFKSEWKDFVFHINTKQERPK